MKSINKIFAILLVLVAITIACKKENLIKNEDKAVENVQRQSQTKSNARIPNIVCIPYRDVVGMQALVKELNTPNPCAIPAAVCPNTSTMLTTSIQITVDVFFMSVGNGTFTITDQNTIINKAISTAIAQTPAGYTFNKVNNYVYVSSGRYYLYATARYFKCVP